MDPDTGELRCWECYLQNRYHNFIGKPVATYTKENAKDGDYILRMIVVAEHEVHIEGWHINIKKGIIESVGRALHYTYMSQAGRDWKRFVRELDNTGKINFR
jgi:hypothetical protein